MGMFDSTYDTEGNEWQTKAFRCVLANYHIGDKLPAGASTYQLEVLGGPDHGSPVDSYATVRDGRLASVNDQRDKNLALIDYGGHWVDATEGA